MKERRRRELIKKGWLSENKFANYISYITFIAFVAMIILCVAVIV